MDGDRKSMETKTKTRGFSRRISRRNMVITHEALDHLIYKFEDKVQTPKLYARHKLRHTGGE
ncbi:predicted protein [Sclerotinia sclerotiorum 1980 UF-70]|uniref:Uncharacterized protein n=2 Tax=Sclerotinia sclerotiorum TaxID=5180 RepID=A7EE88_SCLS1|nr:predicted protein [Sclerotinia sclerotiorum 1980 UF-70]EDO01154.1 predicted protein [Sclerotinia sclerotiorum 1980 UF-70]